MASNRCILVFLLLLASLSTRAQTFYGYSFTTGVDDSKWITLTNPDTIRSYYDNVTYSPMVELDFPFGFFGTYIHSFSISRTGMIVCNRTYNSTIPIHSLDILCQVYSNPLIFIYGQMSNVNVMAVCQTVGSPGNRTLVCEITRKQTIDTTKVSHYQFQMDEATCAFRFVYGINTDHVYMAQGQIGFTGLLTRCINISPRTHGASTNGEITNSLTWPGDHRYYQFAPFCANPVDVRVSQISHNSARVSWTRMGNDSCYIVRYNRAGSGYTERTVRDTTIYITGLRSCSLYKVQVFSVCRNGQTSEAAPVRFRTVAPSCSNIPFTSLWDDFVECRTGSFLAPSTQIEVVDSGYQSDMSRHTVHIDTSERDVHTGNQLRTVPVGHCSSVRLGNSRIGSEQESITYTLRVDTNNYDLLVLRYAIVEEDPEHAESDQPHVVFSITDSAGNLTGSCNNANFISGSQAGWIRTDTNIVWRDWSAYGVNLAEFHGQNIHVTISNFDCGAGAHWGYVYFTMEGVSKRLTSTVCGSTVENTFYAPQGFNYRWYSADNPSVTLSTADSLQVTTPGLYYCHATYQLAGSECGFTIASRAGMRYPMARFTSSIVDSCGSVRYFVNQSVVTTDAAHTQLTSEPCEKYLWRFSDGTTDSAINVTHTFSNGTHTVTLIAMLANGDCIDSVSQTFTVSIPSDTIHASSCWGNSYQFGGMTITEAGQYSYVEDCVEHILLLTIVSTPPTTVTDTICMGDTLFFGNTAYFATGYYTHTFLSQFGCDSVVNLLLRCMPRYNVEVNDTLPYGDQYPIGDTTFTAPGQYSYLMSSIYGCDSLLNIRLSCVTNKDTTVCITSLPFVWDTLIFTEAGQRKFYFTNQAGTDSIIIYTLHVREPAYPQLNLDQNCDTDRYFIVEVGGGYHYSWLTDPSTSGIDIIVEDSLYYVRPLHPSYYYIYADYTDEPSCPATDSIYLDTADLQFIVINFSISPEYPTSETSSLTLTDQSHNILSREWYVNGQLCPETNSTIEVDLSLSDDTVEVCLIGYRRFCHLSLCKKVFVDRQSIYFPNAFTPDRESNNYFTAIGVGIAEFEMWVYDRRGALMFHTTDMQQGWDGTSGGIKCRQEVYAYTCRYRIKHQFGYRTHTGTVLLLR